MTSTRRRVSFARRAAHAVRELFLTPDDYLQVLRDRWLVVVFGTAVGAILGLAFGVLIPPTNQATAEIRFTVAPASSSAGELEAASALERRLAVTYGLIATSGDVMEAAADHAQLSIDQVRSSTRAFAVVSVPVVRITAIGATPDDAVALAAAVADATRAAFDAAEASPPAESVLITNPASNVNSVTPPAPFFAAGGALAGIGAGLFGAFAAGPKRRRLADEEASPLA